MVLPHFRSCGGIANRLPRAYFAGDSAEIGWMLAHVSVLYPDRPRFAAGVSLGGNALLKWLGESADAARTLVQAAAGLSAPVDLTASGLALQQGFNRLVYTRYFLRSLIPKTRQKLQQHPALASRINPEKLDRISTLGEFDDLYTAPMHGFTDGKDYWQRASSKPWLKTITVPTLVLNARNDPFVPAWSLPGHEDVSQHVTLLQPEQGGHIGFVSGPFPGRNNWVPAVLIDFFRRQNPA
jgi:predicted alpha/beta-fold hydrolase